MDFENSKYAAQFPFPQPQNSSLAPNATPSIDFSLNMLATGRVGPTIRIFVVTQPLSFPSFNRVLGAKFHFCSKSIFNDSTGHSVAEIFSGPTSLLATL